MARTILYSIARTPSGELIKASDAEKGQNYVCPSCETELVLRKGSKKRPHFAHKKVTENCTPETALHFGFKILLAQRIQKSIDSAESLPFLWNCNFCSGKHEGDLVKKATQVKVEYDLGICQPDIALVDSSNSVVAAIEVVVSHSPEEKVIGYYKQNGIALVIFELESDEDIHLVDETVLKPTSVSVCRNPKCSKCKQYMTKDKLLIYAGECWKCHAPMKVAALKDSAHYTIDLTPEAVKLANENGAFVKQRYSKTVNDRYYANTCKKCGTFIGSHFVFRDYIASYIDPLIELETDFSCPHCT